MTTVRETRRADELKPGDWIAAGELAGWAAEVRLADPYTDAVENDKVLLVYRVLGQSKPDTTRTFANHEFELSTDAEIAEHRAEAERAKKIGDIRALADWLEANPWLPIADLDVNRHLYGEDGYRTVVELAGRLGAKLDTRLDDRTKFAYTRGPLTYTLLAWHEKGRPAEPLLPEDAGRVADREVAREQAVREDAERTAMAALTPDAAPENVAEHRHAGGSFGGPGENSAECACGTVFDGFDTPAEAGLRLAQHIDTENSAVGAPPCWHGDIVGGAPCPGSGPDCGPAF